MKVGITTDSVYKPLTEIFASSLSKFVTNTFTYTLRNFKMDKIYDGKILNFEQ